MPEHPLAVGRALLVLTHPDRMPAQAIERVSGWVSRPRCVRSDSQTAILQVDAVARGRRAPLAHACRELGLDHALLREPRSFDGYGVLVCDMDSTLITIECIDELAARMGCGEAVAALTARAMTDAHVDYDQSLRSRVRLLAGLPVSDLEWVYAHRLTLMPGAEAFVADAQAASLHTGIVSGGFDYFTERLRCRLAFAFAHGNRLVVRDGVLTGEMCGPLVNAAYKAAALTQVCREQACPPARAIAVGDGANDLGMMAVAGLAVGFRPKDIVAAYADVVIWSRLDRLGDLLSAGHQAWVEMMAG